MGGTGGEVWEGRDAWEGGAGGEAQEGRCRTGAKGVQGRPSHGL